MGGLMMTGMGGVVVVVSGVPIGGLIGIRVEGGVIGVFSASAVAPGQQDSSMPL
jgi:hypothetical protein